MPSSSLTKGISTMIDLILSKPDTYIGSTANQSEERVVMNFSTRKLVTRRISFAPGLYNIFDHILTKAVDNKKTMTKMEVKIGEDRIVIFSNGNLIPVSIHPTEKVYLPETIFGSISSGSLGVILANIFSTEFMIEITNRRKLYKHVFYNNMKGKQDPMISGCNKNQNWIKVTFKPDFSRFQTTRLEDDIISLMKTRVIEVAASLGQSVTDKLNGQRIQNYINGYLNGVIESPRTTERLSERSVVCVSRSDGFQAVHDDVNELKAELERVREDRDRQVLDLNAKIDNLTIQNNVLEVCSLTSNFIIYSRRQQPPKEPRCLRRSVLGGPP